MRRHQQEARFVKLPYFATAKCR